jgi:hypothetical protein
VRKKKQFSNLTKQIFHSEVKECLTCQSRLKRFATLSQRIVITLEGAIQVVHCGYRCPNQKCSTVHRVYRSALADGLALPGFTFGLDVVILVGHLRLTNHQTVDEVHQTLQERLSPFHLTISRREVMYLFEAYCSVLRAAHQPSDTPHWQTWRAKVEENGGVIISIDGIQPDKGNETIYLVRDVLTGRVLCAENVSSSETEVMKEILSPVVKLGVPVLGVISDAQVSEVLAVVQLWPTVPHQTCQFHYLREATRPMYDLDQKMRTAMRKTIQNKLRETRGQVRHQLQELRDAVEPEQRAEREQLQILAEYATGIQTVLNLEGNRPFAYPGLAGYDALAEIEVSLIQLAKKGERGVDPST